jgi:hypothetical protein
MMAMFRRLLAIGPVLALLALCSCGGLALTASATDEWTHTYPLAAGGEVSIENTNGRVEVEAADGSTVEVRAERIAKAATESSAKELLPRIKIEEDIKPDRVAISTSKMNGVMIGASFEVRYRVRAPKAASVKVTNTNGSITVSSMTGGIEAHGTNGGVTGKALAGGVIASVVNGQVNVDLAAVGSQKVSLHTTNGAVSLALPDEAKADVDAMVTNGWITVSGVKIEVIEQSRRRIQGRMNGGGTPIELRTVNGSVRIRSRAAAAAEAERRGG